MNADIMQSFRMAGQRRSKEFQVEEKEGTAEKGDMAEYG
jgi:hypothetical protein